MVAALRPSSMYTKVHGKLAPIWSQVRVMPPRLPHSLSGLVPMPLENPLKDIAEDHDFEEIRRCRPTYPYFGDSRPWYSAQDFFCPAVLSPMVNDKTLEATDDCMQ